VQRRGFGRIDEPPGTEKEKKKKKGENCTRATEAKKEKGLA